MSLKYRSRFGRGCWQVQEAKARFSELFRKARTEGVQRVAHHGREAVVVLSQEEFDRLCHRTARKEGLVKFMERSPWAGLKTDLNRTKDDFRSVDI
ncbi:MAG: type II toxin-antitoxin system Phd/YefM family antitoxin [Elusimicrobia bacterium]|nr:type II toxin-antitoxin system Phd/YefM family antitoxin [Elusimicrobiota bacterium]